MLEKGITYTAESTVGEDNWAKTLGSGDLEVFATPAMVALMENAAMNCVAPHLEEGQTTVGIEISTTHSKASATGWKVSVIATLTEIDDRKLRFEITAADQNGEIGRASHSRFIVDREKFIKKLING